MIASVSGQVAAVGSDSAVLTVGGIGLKVQCTPSLLAGLRVGEQALLATSLVVREDSLTLFGFADAEERSVFETLQSATGVGPRLAQSVLAVLTPDAIRRAVANEDLAVLTRVPGIGRKGAERIVLELRDRIGQFAQPGTGPARGVSEEVRAGLLELGYSAREADEALAAVAEAAARASGAGEPAVGTDAASLLRSALTVLRRS
ncbi:MAG: Holliday junction branch migration protein RuvA [Mycobacteriales bacterium]